MGIKPNTKAEIKFLKNLQKLDVKDGDIIVLQSQYKLSCEMINTLKNTLESTIADLGKKIKVLILDEGMNIGVLCKYESMGLLKGGLENSSR